MVLYMPRNDPSVALQCFPLSMRSFDLYVHEGPHDIDILQKHAFIYYIPQGELHSPMLLKSALFLFREADLCETPVAP